MRVLGISGSLRAESYNSRLLALAGELLPGDAEFVVWRGLKEVPPFDEDERQAGFCPPAITELAREIEAADAMVIATPEYNHSIPGALKNALDWLSRPLDQCAVRGKPVLVIGASTSTFGGIWAQAEMRKVMGALGGRVLDRDLAVARAQREDAFEDEALRESLSALLGELLAEAQPVQLAA